MQKLQFQWKYEKNSKNQNYQFLCFVDVTVDFEQSICWVHNEYVKYSKYFVDFESGVGMKIGDRWSTFLPCWSSLEMTKIMKIFKNCWFWGCWEWHQCNILPNKNFWDINPRRTSQIFDIMIFGHILDPVELPELHQALFLHFLKIAIFYGFFKIFRKCCICSKYSGETQETFSGNT